jgi:hypothetical protein
MGVDSGEEWLKRSWSPPARPRQHPQRPICRLPRHHAEELALDRCRAWLASNIAAASFDSLARAARSASAWASLIHIVTGHNAPLGLEASEPRSFSPAFVLRHAWCRRRDVVPFLPRNAATNARCPTSPTHECVASADHTAPGQQKGPSLARWPCCPATADEISDALSFALRYDGRKRVNNADIFMARITAERVVHHPTASGFVLMKRPPDAAPAVGSG